MRKRVVMRVTFDVLGDELPSQRELSEALCRGVKEQLNALTVRRKMATRLGKGVADELFVAKCEPLRGKRSPKPRRKVPKKLRGAKAEKNPGGKLSAEDNRAISRAIGRL